MPQKSNIDKLETKTRKRLIELLQNPSVTLDDVVTEINNITGEKSVSRSGVSRYKKRLDEILEKKKQVEAIANAWNKKQGDELGNLIGKQTMEELRLLVYDFVGKLQDMQEKELDTMSLEDLSQTAFSIEKASKSIVNLEQAISKNATHTEGIKQATLSEAQTKINQNAERAGVSKETVNTILKDVFNDTNKNGSKVKRKKCLRYVLTDHYSGSICVRYYSGYGEAAEYMYDFLLYAWGKKDRINYSFHGVPELLLWDKGSANTSKAVTNALKSLGVKTITHKAGSSRVKGQVENANNIVETHFECFLRFEGVKTIE